MGPNQQQPQCHDWSTTLGRGCPVALSSQSSGLESSSTRIKPHKLSMRSGGSKISKAFYSTSLPSSRPLVYFEVKYYGLCTEIPTTSSAPVVVNVKKLLSRKKKENDAIKAFVYCSERGLAVIEKNSEVPIISWFTHDIASLASVKYPLRNNRRIALMKVRSPQGQLEWHLFKYPSAKTDHFSLCFRSIVDCSLRDIGRKVAFTRPELLRPIAARSAALSHDGLEEEDDDDDVPPRYSPLSRSKSKEVPEDSSSGYLEVFGGPSAVADQQQLRRQLHLDHVADKSVYTTDEDAIMEAADIAASLQRMDVLSVKNTRFNG